MKWWPFLLLLLLLPLATRTIEHNNLLIGEESYFHKALVENVNGESFPVPSLSSSFHFFVALLSKVIPLDILAKIIPLLLAVANAFLFYSISKRRDAVILFIISPIFLFIHTTFTPFSFVLFLALLSWRLRLWWSLIPLVLLGSVNTVAFISTCLLLWTLGRSWKIIAASFVVVLGGIIQGWIHFGLQISSFVSLFAGFGFGLGFSLFMIVLSLIGLFTHTPSKKSVGGALVLALATIIPVVRIVLLPVVALLGARGLEWLVKRNWSVQRLRNITLFVLALGFLFSLVMILTSQIKSEPSLERAEALTFLQNLPKGLVLSSVENSMFIESVSGKTSFVDASSSLETFASAHTLLFTRDESNSTILFKKHKIKYVFIDPVMLDTVWTHDEEGLLWLLKTSPRFQQVYAKEGYTIYSVEHPAKVNT